jgi:SAM-dependent methyltransferase
MTIMRGNSHFSSSYRDSHSSPGYGEIYNATYEEGYYADQWRLIERPLLVDILSRLVAGKPQARYLDFACGTGRILATAEDIFEDCTGVDVSPEMLKVARKFCSKSRLLQQDITVQPISERFDVVTAFRFFLNAEEDLTDQVLQAMHASMNGDGRLVMNIHVNQTSPLGIYYAIRSWFSDHEWDTRKSLPAMRDALERNGFEIETVHWYGLLPRFGGKFERISRALMLPLERVLNTFAFLRPAAQCFLLVCRKI